MDKLTQISIELDNHLLLQRYKLMNYLIVEEIERLKLKIY